MGKTEQALRIVGKIYEAGLDEGDWADVMSAMADFCGVANVSLVVRDAQTGSPTIISPRAEPDMVRAYARDWWQQDPMLPSIRTNSEGKIATLTGIDREDFLNSAFHNSYWQRLGFGSERAFANLLVRNDAFVSCGLQPYALHDMISGEAQRRFSLFVPHFIYVLEIAHRLKRMEFEIAAVGQTTQINCTGVMIVDADLRILFADEEAEHLLARRAGLRADRGRLRIDNASADEKLRAAVTASQRAPVPKAVREIPLAGARRLSVIPYCSRMNLRIAGPHPAAMVMFSDPNHERQARIERFRASFGFTPAEAELAFEMLKGDGRGAAAARCGISINTARTHLTRIFEKTAVSRQAELIGVLIKADKAI